MTRRLQSAEHALELSLSSVWARDSRLESPHGAAFVGGNPGRAHTRRANPMRAFGFSGWYFVMQQHGSCAETRVRFPPSPNKAWMVVTGTDAALETRNQPLTRLKTRIARWGYVHWRGKPDAGFAHGLHHKAPSAPEALDWHKSVPNVAGALQKAMALYQPRRRELSAGIATNRHRRPSSRLVLTTMDAWKF